MAAYTKDVFVDAAACGDMNYMKGLLEDTSVTVEMINALDKDGRSAFHYACLNDDEPLLKLLLADERVDVTLRSPTGNTCFHLGASYSSLQALKLLLVDSRASILLNEKNKWGETALHLCAGSADKGAGKTAALLLEAGASVTEIDQWKRGPLDIARDNGEQRMIQLLESYVADPGRTDLKDAVDEITAAYKADTNRSPAIRVNKGIMPKGQGGPAAMFGDIAGARKGLKKVQVQEKTMFAASKVYKPPRDAKYIAEHDARSTGKLSKLIDFPGDVEEISGYLTDPEVDPAGCDAYGLSALHKFASWNKVELIDMILPKLSNEQINAQDPSGKTALHWACEMASVGAVERLVACTSVDQTIKNGLGKTAWDILNDASGTASVVDRLKKILEAAKAN